MIYHERVDLCFYISSTHMHCLVDRSVCNRAVIMLTSLLYIVNTSQYLRINCQVVTLYCRKCLLIALIYSYNGHLSFYLWPLKCYLHTRWRFIPSASTLATPNCCHGDGCSLAGGGGRCPLEWSTCKRSLRVAFLIS